MSDVKHVYLPRLFGGSLHGKRMALANPIAPYQTFTSLFKSAATYYTPSSATKPVTALTSEYLTYLRHDFAFGRRMVHAFVINTKRNEEAFEMVCNYLLRTALPC